LKPTLLVFRPPMHLIPLNNQHVQFFKVVKAFEVNFKVVIIDYSCNYNEILEKYKPDIALFHFEEGTIGAINILSVKNNNSIPKTGLATIDSSSIGKGFFYRFMQQYGVEDIFSIEVTTGEVFPEINNNLFYIPHFIDSDINFDYKLEKNIPVLLTGHFEHKFYEWRSKVKKPILDNFPSLYYRHPGYYTDSLIPNLLRIHGESYFRTLNASWIVPTCGSFKNTILMKHFEIPGAKSCLVCDENETVKLHGFRDMENCVFSEPELIVEKLNYLFNNPDILQKIINNGYNLVHSIHTYKQRPQLFQWYQLIKQRKNNQKIIQPSLLGDLELIDINSKKETLHIRVANDVKQIIAIDELIGKMYYYNAELKSKNVIEFAEYIHDAKLRLYLIHMLNGRKTYAYFSLKELLNYRIDANIIPDPLDLTSFIIHLLSKKQYKKAVYYSKIELTKRRKELDYIRLLAFKLGSQKTLFNLLLSEIIASKGRTDIKTMYYFYSDKFNLLAILERIVKKNVIRKKNTWNDLIHLPISQSIEKLKLIDMEEEFNGETLKIDIESIYNPVTYFNKTSRKIQLFLNQIYTVFKK
jgi:hypothetical protein